uniref:Fibrinogen C-terminal domain-containing protein n=1 Tax=Athene cunicularia TaxID=194338 RepID=A0A663MQS6_ATHCN
MRKCDCRFLCGAGKGLIRRVTKAISHPASALQGQSLPLLLPAPCGSAFPGPSSLGARGLPLDPDGSGRFSPQGSRLGHTLSSCPPWWRYCSHLPSSSPSGVYVIQPAASLPRAVWCDMDTEGKGWTVVQRNTYTTEITWKESWTTYKYGFGNVQGDHWLGTEYLHLLTQQGTYKVRFIVRNKANVTHYAEYDIFRVENEASGYPLRLGRFSGDGDDYLTSYHPKKGGIHDNMNSCLRFGQRPGRTKGLETAALPQ